MRRSGRGRSVLLPFFHARKAGSRSRRSSLAFHAKHALETVPAVVPDLASQFNVKTLREKRGYYCVPPPDGGALSLRAVIAVP